ncbi:efflux transporter outer membrane subunit [Sphingomonas sp.]|uniref:efflux transporter outer membrane subunit n=1 Tax=Sphingomonas sp. TaxID=28214 RepID=UPI003B3A7604
MKKSAALAAILSLTGCSLAPHYDRPVAALPTSFKEAPGWKPATPADAIAKGEWWLLFDDPVLTDLETRVVRANQNVAAAVAAYDQARAAVREVRAGLLPVIDLSASALRAGSFGGGETQIIGGNTVNVSRGNRRFAVGSGVTWQPDLFGQVRSGVRQQTANAQASQADLANITLAAQGDLAINYFQLRGIETRKAILDTTVAAYERALKINANRYEQGVVAKVDVLQAQSQLDSARANAADLVRQRAVLQHAIAVLVGESPSTFTLAPQPWKRAVPEIPGVLPATVLERRPDVASAERRVAAANAAIGVERAAFFPSLTLSGDIGTQASRLGDLFTATSSIWSLGISGALTLFDFGARSARVAQARAAYEQTVAQYRQSVLVAFQEAEDALAAGNTLSYVEQQRRSAAASANQVETLTQNQYVAGQVAYSDVIVAQTTAFTAREAEVQAVVDRQVAAINLIQAIGGSWPRS